MLKHFANKYAINEKQKQLIHLECFYTFFFDSVYYQNVTSLNSFRRLYSVNCQLLDYTTQMLAQLDTRCLTLETIVGAGGTGGTSETNSSQVDDNYNPAVVTTPTTTTTAIVSSSNSPKKSQQQIVGSFIKKTLALPFKIVLLLSDFRTNFAVKYRLKRGGRIELVNGGGDDVVEAMSAIGETAIDEMREMVLLFRTVCACVQNLANVNPTSCQRFEQIEAKFANKFSITKSRFGYDLFIQFELIKQVPQTS